MLAGSSKIFMEPYLEVLNRYWQMEKTDGFGDGNRRCDAGQNPYRAFTLAHWVVLLVLTLGGGYGSPSAAETGWREGLMEPRRLSQLSPVVVIGQVISTSPRNRAAAPNGRSLYYHDTTIRLTQILRKPARARFGPTLNVRTFLLNGGLEIGGQHLLVERQIELPQGKRVLLFLTEEEITSTMAEPRWKLTGYEWSIFSFISGNELAQNDGRRYPLRALSAWIHTHRYAPKPPPSVDPAGE